MPSCVLLTKWYPYHAPPRVHVESLGNFSEALGTPICTEINTSENLEICFQINSPRFSFAFAFAMIMLGTHKPQQQAALTKTKEIREIFFAFAFVIQQREHLKSQDFYFFALVILVGHRCCDHCRTAQCRAHRVAANSRNLRDVAGVSRTYLASPLSVSSRRFDRLSLITRDDYRIKYFFNRKSTTARIFAEPITFLFFYFFCKGRSQSQSFRSYRRVIASLALEHPRLATVQPWGWQCPKSKRHFLDSPAPARKDYLLLPVSIFGKIQEFGPCLRRADMQTPTR